MQKLTLLPPADYLAGLTKAIRQSKRRVLLNAMIGLWDESVTGPVFHALYEALDRGVEAHVLFDTYSLLPFVGGMGMERGYWKRRKGTLATYASLRDKGAAVHLVGKTRANPFKGRYHAKISLADDQFFTFGGINFSAESFTSHDYMLTGKDGRTADFLWQLVQEFEAGHVTDDIDHQLSATDTLLFDAGTPSGSIIYDTACDLAARATKVWFISQMPPSNRLAYLIKQTNYACYFNRPSQPHFPTNLAVFADQQWHGVKNSYKNGRYIHAKFILFEMEDGSKALVSGSNNFSWRGVKYGTQEIALFSTDEAVWNQLYQFAARHIF